MTILYNILHFIKMAEEFNYFSSSMNNNGYFFTKFDKLISDINEKQSHNMFFLTIMFIPVTLCMQISSLT